MRDGPCPSRGALFIPPLTDGRPGCAALGRIPGRHALEELDPPTRGCGDSERRAIALAIPFGNSFAGGVWICSYHRGCHRRTTRNVRPGAAVLGSSVEHAIYDTMRVRSVSPLDEHSAPCPFARRPRSDSEDLRNDPGDPPARPPRADGAERPRSQFSRGHPCGPGGRRATDGGRPADPGGIGAAAVAVRVHSRSAGGPRTHDGAQPFDDRHGDAVLPARTVSPLGRGARIAGFGTGSRPFGPEDTESHAGWRIASLSSSRTAGSGGKRRRGGIEGAGGKAAATVETLARELESRKQNRIVGVSRSWKDALSAGRPGSRLRRRFSSPASRARARRSSPA